MSATTQAANLPLVIIVDPDPHICVFLSRYAKDAGYQVRIATDGYDALDSARLLVPSAIIADIMLPKLDGLTLCRLIKSDPVTSASVKVILLSALSSADKAMASGADAFVLKPLEKSKIMTALQEQFKGESRE